MTGNRGEKKLSYTATRMRTQCVARKTPLSIGSRGMGMIEIPEAHGQITQDFEPRVF